MDNTPHNIYSGALGLFNDFNTQTNGLIKQLTTIQDKSYLEVLTSVAENVRKECEKICDIGNLLPPINEYQYVSPLLEMNREAHLAITDLLKVDIANPIFSITNDTNVWANQIQSCVGKTSLLGQEAMYKISDIDVELKKLSEISIQKHLVDISEISVLTESSLATLNSVDIGKKLAVDLMCQNELNESLLDFSKEYTGLCNAYKDNPSVFTNLGPSLTALTPIEYFNAVDLYDAISSEEKVDDHKDSKRQEISDSNLSELERYLPKINPGLITLWRGANQSLVSDNPDKIRHFSTSIRELLTQVLHELAPDEDIKAWSADSIYFCQGRPTRKARLMYICRGVNESPFNTFVEKDVNSTLEFINLFQVGTHKVESSFSKRQLLALKSRAESTIKYLFEISHE